MMNDLLTMLTSGLGNAYAILKDLVTVLTNGGSDGRLEEVLECGG